jgi:hypothetical protein
VTLGTGNKKSVIALCVLGVIALYGVYSSFFSGPDIPAGANATQATGTTPSAAPVFSQPNTRPAPKRAGVNRSHSEEWHLVYLSKRLEERPDPTVIDPTIHWEKLAKVQAVALSGGGRNLFQFSAPPPKPADVAKPTGPEPKVFVAIGPKLPPPPAPPPPPPPPPPIRLKFYGYTTLRADGKRTAYFLDDAGDIFKADEGDTVQRRYKIIRIGPNSVLIEDTDVKHQQSVPLTPEGSES